MADLGLTAIPDSIYGDGYACSAVLTDKTTLPCVIIREARPLVDLAKRRIAEESNRNGSTRELWSAFVTQGNRLNGYDIAKIERSPFALPNHLRQQIRGETAMGLTAFVLETADGRAFAFSTSFYFDFFELPEGVAFSDFAVVHNDSIVDDAGQILSVHHSAPDRPMLRGSRRFFRERPFFECYLREL